MSDIHSDPAANGQLFGEVIVTIDQERGDAVFHIPLNRPLGPESKRIRLHSVEEILNTYLSAQANALHCSTTAQFLRALKFAAQRLGQ